MLDIFTLTPAYYRNLLMMGMVVIVLIWAYKNILLPRTGQIVVVREGSAWKAINERRFVWLWRKTFVVFPWAVFGADCMTSHYSPWSRRIYLAVSNPILLARYVTIQGAYGGAIFMESILVRDIWRYDNLPQLMDGSLDME